MSSLAPTEVESTEVTGAYRVPPSEEACPGEDEEVADARRAVAKVRALAGLPALRCDARAAAAARGHCQYIRANGVALTHMQQRGRAGFTGVTFEDRLASAKFAEAGGGEVLANITGGRSVSSADGYLNSVYHRALFLRVETTSFGYGSDGACSTIDFGRPKDLRGLKEVAVMWPPDGAKNVPVEFYAARELPNPVPGRDLVGSPVSLIRIAPLGTVTATLEGPDGRVASTTLTQKSDPNKFVRAGEAHLVPLAPLAPNTMYRAHFSVSGTGRAKPETFSTTFTTVPN